MDDAKAKAAELVNLVNANLGKPIIDELIKIFRKALEIAPRQMHELDETRINEALAALHREFQDRAKPLIDRMVEIQASKPRPPMVIFYCPGCGKLCAPHFGCTCTNNKSTVKL